MASTLFFVVLIATFVTMVLIPPLVRLAEWLHMVDLPGERKIHTTPVPRLGGLAISFWVSSSPFWW